MSQLVPMDLTQAAIAYIQEFTGEPTRVRTLAQGDLERIPFMLRDTYALSEVETLGRTFVLAVSKADDQPTPSTAGKHASLIRERLGREVALAFGAMPAYNRQRLVARGTAFVVPRAQLFLPFLGVEYRSRARTQPQPEHRGGPLPFPAQAVLLYHLQSGPLESLKYDVIARLLGYSNMTVTRASRALVASGLCTSVPDGVRRSLRFAAGGRTLWEKARPLLRSPVQRAVLVEDVPAWAQSAPRAGMSALSAYTLLDGGEPKVIAVHDREWRQAEATPRELPSSADAPVRMELWRYDPSLMARDGTVDRLSLYLSLAPHHDERVQSALEQLLREVRW
jgi:hypothetical protein